MAGRVAVVVLALAAAGAAVKVEYDYIDPIPMYSNVNLTLRLSFDETTDEEFSWPRNQLAVLSFDLLDKVSWAVKPLNESLTFDFEQIRRRRPQNLLIYGAMVGLNDVLVYGHAKMLPGRPGYNDDDDEDDEDEDSDEFPPIAATTTEAPHEHEDDHEHEGEEEQGEEEDEAEHMELSDEERVLMRAITVKVIVSDLTLNNLFTIILTLMIVVNTVNMGSQLDLDIIRAVFKRPIGPIVGFVSQFLFMPLFAFGIGWLLSSDTLFRLGLFVLGCCPGGSASNFWCILLNGDLNLSITMTFISTVAALGMMPLWLALMGPLLSEGDLVIPYGQLIMTLVSLIAPISLGMWIRYRWPKASEYMQKIIVPFTLLTVLFIFTAGIYINLHLFMLITGPMVAAGYLVAAAGYCVGGLMAWLFKLTVPQITAVSIETAFQNGGIAFILLKVSMPAPYGDLATVAPVAQLMITGTPLWAVLIVLKLYQRFCRKQTVEPLQQTAEEEKTLDGKTELTFTAPDAKDEANSA